MCSIRDTQSNLLFTIDLLPSSITHPYGTSPSIPRPKRVFLLTELGFGFIDKTFERDVAHILLLGIFSSVHHIHFPFHSFSFHVDMIIFVHQPHIGAASSTFAGF